MLGLSLGLGLGGRSVDNSGGDATGFASRSLNIGRETRSGFGAVPLSSSELGVLLGGTVTTWSLVKTSGPAVWPATVTTGETPAPTAHLTGATDAGTQAIYQVWADGVDTGATLTLNVQSLAETEPAITVSKGSEIDSSSTGLRAAAVKSTLGGKRIQLQVGSEAQWANPTNALAATNVCYWRGFNTHTGRFTVESSDPARQTTVGRMHFIGCAGVDLRNLKFRHGISPWDGVTSGATHSNKQGAAMLHLDYSASFGVCADITVFSTCTFGAPDGPDADNPTTWKTGIKFNGEGSVGGPQIGNVLIDGVAMDRVFNGVTGTDANGLIVQNHTINRFCSNAMFMGGGQLVNITVQDGLHSRPMANPADPADHPDFLQVGSSLVNADYSGIVIRRMALLTLDGTSKSQGPFTNDVGFSNVGTGALLSNGQKLTGFKFVNCEISNIFYEGIMANATTLDLGSGWTVRNITAVRGPGLSITNASGYYDPVLRVDVLTETVSGATQTATGSAKGIVANNLFGGTGLALADNAFLGASGIDSGTNNVAAWLAFYATKGFNDPTHADPRIGFRPAAGGALMMGAGRYAGAYNPDGSWADVRV